ncbi:MAG: hypothetical protein KGS45_07740 [Planctomycetes bacterium]|nr:hypothetical protein [Planctomycetota bacterium]
MSIPKPLVKVGIGCLVVLLTCFGGVGFMAWRILGGTVKPTTDYAGEINTLVASYQKEAEAQPDAWDELMVLLDTSKQLHEAARTSRTGEFANILPDPSLLRSLKPLDPESVESKPENLDSARKLLDDLHAKGAFKDLDALAPRMRAVRKLKADGGMLIEVLLPNLASSRQLARANAARYHLAVMRGDLDEAVKAFESGLALGRFFMQQGILIDRLVGQAIVSLHTTAMQETIDKITDEATLKHLLAALDRQTKTPPVVLFLEAERRSILDTIQWTFTDLGDGNGYLSPQRFATVQSLSGNRMPGGQVFLGIVMADRKETTAALNRYFDEMGKYATLPRFERIKSTFQPDVEVEQLSQRYLMLEMLLPAFGSALNTDDRWKMEIAGVRTILGLEIWRRGHGGEPPAKLDDLVPGFLSQLPIDVFTGSPFGYKVLAPGSDAAGRRYLVYSFGTDGIDDGGVEMPDKPGESGNRHRALNRTPGTPGFDFVINYVEPPAAAPAKSGN